MHPLFPHPPQRPRQRTARTYQRRAVDDVKSALHNRPLLVAPTGAGKTFMAAMLVRELNLPTLWLAHRQELIDQAARDLRHNDLHVGIIKAGIEPDPSAPVQVASIQTLRNRRCPPAGLIIVDEAHHASAAGYRSAIDNYPSSVPVVGLTATPFRLDGRGLDMFGQIIVSAYTDELVADGWLHAPRVFAGPAPDLRGIKSTGGDYNLKDLSKRMASTDPADIVKAWQQHCAGMRSVAFAVDVAESQRIAAAFTASGIAAEHLDGSMDPDARKGVLKRLAGGQTLVVSNCMVLTEGWDLPALSCAIVARPTASLNLHLQMIGRVMRAADGKAGCVVLDHAGNHHVHGLVTRRLEYSLDGSKKVGSLEPLGLRQCRQCFVLFESKLPACPECGWTPPPMERVTPETVGSGALVEFVEDFDYRKNIWNLIEAEREANEFAEGWSVYRYRERFGASPVVALIDGRRELIDPKHATQDEKEAVYLGLLATAGMKSFVQGWASHRYREIFGVWPKGFVSRAKIGEKWKEMTGVSGSVQG